MSKNLEVAKEYGAYPVDNGQCGIAFPSLDNLDVYTSRICADKDAEIAKWKSSSHDFSTLAAYNESAKLKAEQQLSTANARIAMKDEALKDLLFAYENYSDIHAEAVAQANCALSASPEQVSTYKAKLLEPLQMQVASQHELLCELQNAFPIGTALHRAVVNAISNTQATAEAYDREHAAKVLEEADVCPDCYRKKAHSVPDIMNGACEKWYAVRDPEARIECNKLAELRAANKKGGE